MNEDIQYKYRCYFEFSSPQSGAPHLRDKKESEIQDIYVISYPITSPPSDNDIRIKDMYHFEV